jgi:Ca-activated chloride channel family protein
MSEIAKIVKQNNIILNVLNIGTKKGTTLNSDMGGFIKDKKGNIVISKRNDSIAKIAQSSGGAFVGVSNDMSKIPWLAKQISKTALKKDMKKDKYEGAKELFYYPLALAIFFLFFVFNSIRFIPILLLFFINTNVHAGMLDFLTIKQANKSYSNKEYKKSAKSFSKLNFDEAIYNQADALYKEKKYKDALDNYKKIKNFKGQKELQRLYNMGNANAKLKQIDKAIKNYENALKINKNDADTKFNLDLLKKQKQKQKQKKKQKKKQNKKNKNKNKKKNKKDNSKEKKKDGKQKSKENKKKKDKQKDKGNTQSKKQSSGKKDKKMSEAEAKKWEKKMNKKEFKTKPYRLEKSTKGNKNEITW